MRLRRAVRAVGLFGVLVAVYFLVYSGWPVSGDEQVMFDGAHSFFRNGTLELGYFSSLRPYFPLPRIEDRPVLWLDVEPLQAYAAAALIWIGAQVRGIGLVHAAWTLNIWVTALTAVVLYAYGLSRGYSDRVALVVALIFGVATIAVPYSRLFFREPLFTLLALICVFALERWRIAGHKRWIVVAAIALAAALLTKGIALLLAPALLVVTLPGSHSRSKLLSRRVFVVAALIIWLAALVVIYQQIAPSPRYRYALAWLRSLDLSYIPLSVSADLISPGFSIWVFSPALLPGIVGAYLLVRERRFREFLVPLTVTASIILGYGLFHGENWYGGLGWGPRYLVPVTPFLALWLLPVVDRLLDHQFPLSTKWREGQLSGAGIFNSKGEASHAPTNRLAGCRGRGLPGLASILKYLRLGGEGQGVRMARAVAIGLLAQSIFVQIIGVIAPLEAYGDMLFRESGRLDKMIYAWQDGTWNPLYTPLVVNAYQSGQISSQIAWIVNRSGAIVVPLCLLTICLGMLAMIGGIGRLSRAKLTLLSTTVLVSISSTLYFGLRSFYNDPRFGGNDLALRGLITNLDPHPGDAVILNDAAYRNFFMNYYTSSEPIYVMPDAPGERSEPDKLPLILSDNPEEQAHPYTWVLLSRLAQTTTRWLFITEFNQYSPGRTRPTENFLTRHYFLGRDILWLDTVRLVIFQPVESPAVNYPPALPKDIDFGAALLIGLDLPLGTTVSRKSAFPVSLVWRHDGWPTDLAPFDYSVNLSLVSVDGGLGGQYAGPPMGSFGAMSTWRNGALYRDNHALDFLPVAAPGDYELRLLVYDWRDGKPLPIRNRADDDPSNYAVIARIHVN